MLGWARDEKRSWWPAEPCTRARAELSWLSLGYVHSTTFSTHTRHTLSSDRIGRAIGIGDIPELVNNDIDRIEDVDYKSDTGDGGVKAYES